MDEDIRAGDQLEDAGEILVILEIGGIAELASVDGVEQRAVLIEGEIRQMELPAGVAALRPLDLDDARAEIAKAQYGPARNWLKSSTTRPASGIGSFPLLSAAAEGVMPRFLLISMFI